MESDVREILKIRISSRSSTDVPYWGSTRSGTYSVKSGYFLIESIRFAGRDGPSSSEGNSSLFKKLWQLKLPPKIMHFVWRVCKGILPTNVELARRGINVDSSCPLCAHPFETSEHVFLHCSSSKEVWKLAYLSPSLRKAVIYGMEDWLLLGLDTLPISEVESVLTIMWWIWYRRNKKIRDNSWFDSAFLVEKAYNFLSEFKQAYVFGKNSSNSSSPPSLLGLDPKKVWRPPPTGVVKINCDASWGDNGLSCRVGLIARDEKGLVLASAGIPIHPCLSVEAAEAQAIVKGLVFALDCSFSSVIIESDAKVVIDTINSGAFPSSSLFDAYMDIAELRVSFTRCSFLFVNRDCNAVAHCLAAWAKDFSSPIYLMEDCPAIAWPLICNDIIAFSS